jgi:hypothetical protein
MKRLLMPALAAAYLSFLASGALGAILKPASHGPLFRAGYGWSQLIGGEFRFPHSKFSD